MNDIGVWAQVREFFWSDPLMGVAVSAAIFAMATTPLAFAVLGRLDWFKARRGRVLQRPEFLSVVMAMLLIMGIPAIFTALVLKSRYFDKNRYEFDPNRTLSVLDQGRQYELQRPLESIYKADEAVKEEMKRLAEERKNLVEGVKKLDEAMLTLRAASGQSPATAQAIPPVLERLAGIRRAVGVDGPQQLMDFTAPPAAIASSIIPAAGPGVPMSIPMQGMPASAYGPATVTVSGLSKPEVDVELASVPEPQKPIAAMLPLSDLPAGWVIGKSGTKHLETFNAENLFEKIDGRAESFLQYNVKGMAYAYYHPVGDESNEAQVYIFEMGDPLKALGKFGSEKPERGKTTMKPSGPRATRPKAARVFYLGKFYYTQIVTTKDDAKLGDFALELARRDRRPAAAGDRRRGGRSGKAIAGPEDVFKLLPNEPKKSGAMFVPQRRLRLQLPLNVFIGRLRGRRRQVPGVPPALPDGRRGQGEVLRQIRLASAKLDGAQVQEVEGPKADRRLIRQREQHRPGRRLFLKGNALGGVNGVPEADKPKAEAFARGFVKDLAPSPSPTSTPRPRTRPRKSRTRG